MTNKLWKKIPAVLVLIIFILSVVPIALAEEGSSNESNDNDEETENEVEVKSDRTDRLEKVLERADKFEETIEKASDKSAIARERLRENLDKAKERYEEAKEKYQEARERYNEHKRNFIEAKVKAKCTEDTDECSNLKKELKTSVKQHLLRTTEVILSSIEKLKDKVEASEQLSDEEKADAIAALDQLAADLEAEKAEIEALSEESTAEELRQEIKDLKELWKEVRKEHQKIIADLVNSKTKDLVETKLSGIITSMEARINSLEKAGIDTAELEEIKEKYMTHLDSVKADYQDAKEEWQSAEDKGAALDDWKEAQKKVHEGMKEAREILRAFTAKYVELRKNNDSDNEEQENESNEDENDSQEQENETSEDNEEE